MSLPNASLPDHILMPTSSKSSFLSFHFLFSPEKYFDMKKNQCKDALDIYKKFLYRMTKLSEFLKVAEVHEHTLFSQENDKYLISFELFCPVCVSQEHAASQYIISTYKIMFFLQRDYVLRTQLC